jgi:lysophospholipase L1-like esterase
MVDRSITDLYVVSLFPTRGNDSHLNNNVKSINVSLEDYCINSNILFINIYPQLVENCELNKELAADDCHLNSNGYKVWYHAIKKYI